MTEPEALAKLADTERQLTELRRAFMHLAEERTDYRRALAPLRAEQTMREILSGPGMTPETAIKIPNRYWPLPYEKERADNPWYGFAVARRVALPPRDGITHYDIRTALVTVGSRKRVYEIVVESEHWFPTTVIAALWKKEETTCTFDGVSAGREIPDQATRAVIHAWGAEKARHYLTVIVARLRLSVPYQEPREPQDDAEPVTPTESTTQ